MKIKRESIVFALNSFSRLVDIVHRFIISGIYQ